MSTVPDSATRADVARPPGAVAGGSPPDPRRWLALAIIAVSQLMTQFAGYYTDEGGQLVIEVTGPNFQLPKELSPPNATFEYGAELPEQTL